MQQKIMG